MSIQGPCAGVTAGNELTHTPPRHPKCFLIAIKAMDSMLKVSIIANYLCKKEKLLSKNLSLLFLSVGLRPVPNCFYVGLEVDKRETYKKKNPNSVLSNTQMTDGSLEANPLKKGPKNLVHLMGPRKLILNPCSIFIHVKLLVT